MKNKSILVFLIIISIGLVSSLITITIISPNNIDYNPNQEINFNISLENSENSVADSCFYSLNSESNTTMNKLNNTYFYSFNDSLLSNQYSVDFFCNETLYSINETSIAVDAEPTLNNLTKANDSNWETFAESDVGSALTIIENYTYNSEIGNSENVSVKIKTNGSSGNTLVSLFNYLDSSYEQIAGYSSLNAGNRSFNNINKTKFVSAGNDVSLRVTMGLDFSDTAKYYESQLIYENSTSGELYTSQETFQVKPNITINSPLNESYTTNDTIFNITAQSNDNLDTCLYSLDGSSNVTLQKFTNDTIGTATGEEISLTFSPNDLDNNGTNLWVTTGAGTDNYVYKTYFNGTIITNFTVGQYPNGIALGEDYIWVTNYFDQEINFYHYNGTLYGTVFTDSSPFMYPYAISIDQNFMWVSTDDRTAGLGNDGSYVYKYYKNGTYTGEFLNTTATGTSYRGLYSDKDYVWVSDTNGDKYKYYVNGTYTGESFTFSGIGNTFGISVYEKSDYLSYLYATDKFNNKFVQYNFDINQLIYNVTNSSMDQGQHNVTFYCNSTNAGFYSQTEYFFIDSIVPFVLIDSITTIEGSQTISFNATTSDTNLQSCKYSIYSNGSIDGTNENVSVSCNNNPYSATVSSYGNFTLRFYAEDSVGNENYDEFNFTTTEAPGGGGSTTIVQPGNWTMETTAGNKRYDVSLIKGTTRDLTTTFYNLGEEEIILTLSCEDVNGTLCQYVELPNQSIELPDLKEIPTSATFSVTLPEDIEDLTASFNIVATQENQASRSITVQAFVGTLNPLQEIISKLPVKTKGNIPYSIILFGSGIIFFPLSLSLSRKQEGIIKFLMVLTMGILLPFFFVYIF